jgi:hypothetical protein
MNRKVLKTMSTTETVPVATENTSSAHITTELVTYRTYGAFDANSQAVGVKEDGAPGGKPSVQSQSNDGKNWAAAEKRGATVLTENAFKFYKLNDIQGLADLIPDPEQQLYIIQKGIDAVQTSAANKAQIEVEEKASKDDPDVFSNNGETIDLREALNTPPQRRNLTDEQKFIKAVGVLSPDKLLAMMENLKKQLEAQSAAS